MDTTASGSGGRARLLHRLGGLAAAASVAGAVYLVAVRRPAGGEVVGWMGHREARPGGPGVEVVGSSEPTDGGRAARAASDLPPVVLVHGLGMSSRALQPLVRRLGEVTWTLAPDLPGYGRSPRPRRGTLDVVQLADAVAGWMRERGVGPAVLVGHSLGAQVVGQLAVRAPDLVQRLVVVAPTGDPGGPGVLGLAGRLLRDGPRERPSLLLVAGLDYLRAGPGQMVALLGRALQRAEQQQDGHLAVPLLVLRGERDPVVRQEWCRELAAGVPDGRCGVVAGGAHGTTSDAPPELVRLVLAEVRAAAAATELL